LEAIWAKTEQEAIICRGGKGNKIMADINLTQAEAEALIAMEKHRLDDPVLWSQREQVREELAA